MTAVYLPSGESVEVVATAPDGVNLVVQLSDGFKFITGRSCLAIAVESIDVRTFIQGAFKNGD